MPRTEIKDFALAAVKGAAAAEHFSAFEPAYEYELIWCWYIKVLAIHFLVLQSNVLRKAGCDRMCWINDPNTLLLARFAPLQIAARTHQLFENFREVAGMQNDQAHAREYTLLNTFNYGVIHLIMPHMSPPNKNVRIRETLLRKSMFRFLKRRRCHFEVAARDPF